MIVAGCDVGSTTGKAVIIEDRTIAAYTIMWCKPDRRRPPLSLYNEALKKAGLSSLEDPDYIVGTGYGRLKAPFANDNISEITCYGK